MQLNIEIFSQIDKISNSGLTPKVAGESVSFEEVTVTLVCKKLILLGNHIVDGHNDFVFLQEDG
ncbi:MAG: hypothetical protein NC307_03065 [Roseburia sp.]|nr:hypothetical protein [Roseburia sp.]